MKRTEYPNPQFERESWLCLNGTWQFDFDDEHVSLKEGWFKPEKKLTKTIEVPFCFESELSGINIQEPKNHVFYKKKVIIPKEFAGKRIILHFGAVDYRCKVFVNGCGVGANEGGHVPFSFDITDYLIGNSIESGIENDISVYVNDPALDPNIPRGKQYWFPKSAGICYTRTTGIWQTVWLEAVSDSHIDFIRLTPDIDTRTLGLTVLLNGETSGLTLEYEISMDSYDRKTSDVIVTDTIGRLSSEVTRTIPVAEKTTSYWGVPWSPENPRLFYITLKLKKENVIVDTVKSYFGMRKIHAQDSMIYLNNQPYYQKLVLDQGYFPGGVMSAADDETYINDIKLAKEMGFNGCRKHGKAEDPRFLYWADKLGFLVWGEMACFYNQSEGGNERFRREWEQVVKRDYNHPSIVAWVPFNESWGIEDVSTNLRTSEFVISFYHFLKSLDSTRLVVNNDGWELSKTDIIGLHNYGHSSASNPKGREFFKRSFQGVSIILQASQGWKRTFAEGFGYEGQPILITECGGISFITENAEGWGYTSAKTEDDFLEQYEHTIKSIKASDKIFGFCYTQLTDIEQEKNGILTFDRKPKCPVEKIKAINDLYRHNVVIDD